MRVVVVVVDVVVCVVYGVWVLLGWAGWSGVYEEVTPPTTNTHTRTMNTSPFVVLLVVKRGRVFTPFSNKTAFDYFDY